MEPQSEDAREASPVSSSRPRWRYRFIVGLIVLAVVVAAAAGWHQARTSGPAYGPVILISIDTLRADHLPAYGYARVRTPAIDALAADSVVFDRAYAHSPQTLPSHIAMLSGRLPFETGVRDNVGFTLPPTEVLLPQLLRRRGFKTGGVVSSYLLREATGLGQAFAFFDDELGPARATTAAEDGKAEAPTPLQRDGLESVRVAERWIDSIGTARFFLFLHLNEPHAPYEPPRRFAKYAPYDGEIAYADELVGKLVEFLKARELYDGAVLLLVSDHGESLGAHGEREHGLFLYEETLRTPFIVKLPRQDQGGRHSIVLVQHLDIVPTVLDLMGAPRPSSLRGRSLRHVLDSADADLGNRQVYAEALSGRYRFGWSELTAITDVRYRFIAAPRPELYDLRQDPKEQHNLVAAEAGTGTAMRASLDRVISGAKIVLPAAIGDDERDALAALGYVSRVPVVAADTPGGDLSDPKDKVAVAEKYHDATDLARLGRLPEAAGKYREVVADDPSLAAGWEQLGDVLVRAGRYKDASEAFAGLAGLYRRTDRAAEAERVLRDLVAAAPTAERYALAIRVWTTLGEKARAAELRAAARKAVGAPALRKSEAAIR